MLTDSVSQDLGDNLSLSSMIHQLGCGLSGWGLESLKAPSLTPGAWARMIQRWGLPNGSTSTCDFLCGSASTEHGSLRIIRLLMWWLRSPSSSLPVSKMEIALLCMIWPQNTPSLPSRSIGWSNHKPRQIHKWGLSHYFLMGQWQGQIVEECIRQEIW